MSTAGAWGMPTAVMIWLGWLEALLRDRFTVLRRKLFGYASGGADDARGGRQSVQGS